MESAEDLKPKRYKKRTRLWLRSGYLL